MKKSLFLGLSLLAAPFAPTAMAGEGDLEYRHQVYEAVGSHMKAMVEIVKGNVAHGDHMVLHANAMADLAVMAAKLFPAGSEGGDALPEIWSNPDDFASKMTAFGDAANGLKAAASSGEGVGPAFQQLAQSCKSCHDSYRKD